MIKTYGNNVRLATLGLAAATVLSVSASAFAAEAPAAKPHSVAVTAPSPELIAGIQELVKRGPAGKPAVQEWPDGTLALTLGGSFLNVLVAQAQTDGTFHTFCVTAPDVVKTLSLAAPAAPAYEEK